MKNELLHEKRQFENVRSLVEWAGDEWSERYAYSYRNSPLDKEPVKVTFHALRNDIRALSSEFISMGCAGKHCAIIGKMSYEWALTYFALLSIGAVIVPLDKEWKSDELADTVAKAEVAYLFCDEDIKDKAAAIEKSVELAEPVVYMCSKESIRNVRMLTAFGEMKFRNNPNAYFEAEIDPQGLAILVFTSGTTGKGKGVMLSQEAVISNVANGIPYIDYGIKTVGVLPPHHTYGSTIMFIGHMIIGSEVYISSGLKYITKEL